MSGRWVVLLSALALAALPAAADSAPQAGSSIHQLAFDVGPVARMNYLLYVPPGETPPPAGWPLILFLHGSEQRGNDPSVLRDLAILAYADMDASFPFVAVLPQCPPGQNWSPPALRKVLAEVEASVRVDRNRVYLTGFSMGGYGTWQTAAALPGTFAAIAPLCGLADVPDAAVLARMPTWVFHGAQDRNVPLSESVRMVAALRRAGGDPRFTVYPDLAHDCWTTTYRESRLYLWFLSHSLASRASVSQPASGRPEIAALPR